MRKLRMRKCATPPAQVRIGVWTTGPTSEPSHTEQVRS